MTIRYAGKVYTVEFGLVNDRGETDKVEFGLNDAGRKRLEADPKKARIVLKNIRFPADKLPPIAIGDYDYIHLLDSVGKGSIKLHGFFMWVGLALVIVPLALKIAGILPAPLIWYATIFVFTGMTLLVTALTQRMEGKVGKAMRALAVFAIISMSLFSALNMNNITKNGTPRGAVTSIQEEGLRQERIHERIRAQTDDSSPQKYPILDSYRKNLEYLLGESEAISQPAPEPSAKEDINGAIALVALTAALLKRKRKITPKSPQAPAPSPIAMRAGTPEGRYEIATTKVVDGQVQDYQGIDNGMQAVLNTMLQRIVTLEGVEAKVKVEGLLGDEVVRKELLKGKTIRIVQGNDRLMHFTEGPDIITIDMDALMYNDLLFLEFIHELLHAKLSATQTRAGPIEEEIQVTAQEVELFLTFPQDIQAKILDALKADNDLDDQEFYKILEKARAQKFIPIDGIRSYVLRNLPNNGISSRIALSYDPSTYKVVVVPQEGYNGRYLYDGKLRQFVEDGKAIPYGQDILARIRKPIKDYIGEYKAANPDKEIVAVVPSGNTMTNDWFVTFINGKLYYPYGELDRMRAESRPYTCLISWKAGHYDEDGRYPYSVKTLTFKDDRAYDSKGDITDEINFAMFGQQIVKNGQKRDIAELYKQFTDVKQIFLYPRFKYLKDGRDFFFGMDSMYKNQELFKKVFAGESIEFSKKELTDNNITDDAFRAEMANIGYKEGFDYIISQDSIGIKIKLNPYVHNLIGVKVDGTIVMITCPGDSIAHKGITITDLQKFVIDNGVKDVILLCNGTDVQIRDVDNNKLVASANARDKMPTVIMIVKKKVPGIINPSMFAEEIWQTLYDMPGTRIPELADPKYGTWQNSITKQMMTVLEHVKGLVKFEKDLNDAVVNHPDSTGSVVIGRKDTKVTSISNESINAFVDLYKRVLSSENAARKIMVLRIAIALHDVGKLQGRGEDAIASREISRPTIQNLVEQGAISSEEGKLALALIYLHTNFNTLHFGEVLPSTIDAYLVENGIDRNAYYELAPLLYIADVASVDEGKLSDAHLNDAVFLSSPDNMTSLISNWSNVRLYGGFCADSNTDTGAWKAIDFSKNSEAVVPEYFKPTMEMLEKLDNEGYRMLLDKFLKDGMSFSGHAVYIFRFLNEISRREPDNFNALIKFLYLISKLSKDIPSANFVLFTLAGGIEGDEKLAQALQKIMDGINLADIKAISGINEGNIASIAAKFNIALSFEKDKGILLINTQNMMAAKPQVVEQARPQAPPIDYEKLEKMWGNKFRDMGDEEFTLINSFRSQGYDAIAKFIPKDARSICETGSGSGRFLIKWAQENPNGTAYGIDITKGAIEAATRGARLNRLSNVSFKMANMFNLPFKDNSFDFIFSEGVVEHYEPADMKLAIQEAIRVTKPGGRLAVTVPNYYSPSLIFAFLMNGVDWRNVKKNNRYRKWRYGYEQPQRPQDLKKIFEECGLKDIKFGGWDVWYGLGVYKWDPERQIAIYPWYSLILKKLAVILSLVVDLLDLITGGWVSRKIGYEFIITGTKPAIPGQARPRSPEPPRLRSGQAVEGQAPPIVQAIAQKISSSEEIIRGLDRETKTTFVIGMYEEQARLMARSAENPLGEDALRKKVEELQELSRINPLFKWQLIFVDDGTPGAASAKCVEDLWKKIQLEYQQRSEPLQSSQVKIAIITPEEKKILGSRKGGAVLKGLKQAEQDLWADYIGYTDVDVSTDMRQTGLLLSGLIAGKYQVAIGSRWTKGAVTSGVSFSGIISSRIYNWCVRLLLPPLRGILDTQRGFKLFKREVVTDILPHAKDNGFSFDTELLLLSSLKGYTLKEVPIAWINSAKASTLNLGADGRRMFNGLFKQRRQWLSGHKRLLVICGIMALAHVADYFFGTGSHNSGYIMAMMIPMMLIQGEGKEDQPKVTDVSSVGTHNYEYTDKHTHPRIENDINGERYIRVIYENGELKIDNSRIGRNASAMDSGLMTRVVELNADKSFKRFLSDHGESIPSLAIYLLESFETSKDGQYPHLLTVVGKQFELASSGTNKGSEQAVYLTRRAFTDLNKNLIKDVLKAEVLMAIARYGSWHKGAPMPLGTFTPEMHRLMERVRTSNTIKNEIREINRYDISQSKEYSFDIHTCKEIVRYLGLIKEQMPGFAPAVTNYERIQKFLEAMKNNDFDSAIEYWGYVTYEFKELRGRSDANAKQLLALPETALFMALAGVINKLFNAYILNHGVYNQNGEEYGKAVGTVRVISDVNDIDREFANARGDEIWIIPYLPFRRPDIPGLGCIVDIAGNRHATDTAKSQAIPFAVIPNATELLKGFDRCNGMLRVGRDRDVRFRTAFNDETGVPRKREAIKVKVPKARTDSKYTYALKDVDRNFVSFVGTKAASLGEMGNAGIPVPEGMVLSFAFWNKFKEFNDIDERIAKLREKIKVESGRIVTDEDALKAVLKEIKQVIIDGNFPPELAEEAAKYVRDARTRYGDIGLYVRSSFNFEDLTERTTAGHYDSYPDETFLDTGTPEKVLQAVKMVFSSMWNEVAFRARINDDVKDRDVMPAVIIQVPVKARMAGTMYTANSYSYSRNEINIMASLGQGAAVVGDHGKPTEVLLDKITGEIKILQGQSWVDMVHQFTDGAMELRYVTPEERDKELLSPDVVKGLGALGEKIEGLYDFRPQDIEWCIDNDGKIWIVQSRAMQTERLPTEKGLDDEMLKLLGTSIDEATLSLLMRASAKGDSAALFNSLRLDVETRDMVKEKKHLTERIIAASHLANLANSENFVNKLKVEEIEALAKFLRNTGNFLDAATIPALLAFMRKVYLLTESEKIRAIAKEFFSFLGSMNTMAFSHMVNLEIIRCFIASGDYKAALGKFRRAKDIKDYPDIADRSIRLLNVIPEPESLDMLEEYTEVEAFPDWVREFARRSIDRLRNEVTPIVLVGVSKESAAPESVVRHIKDSLGLRAEVVLVKNENDLAEIAKQKQIAAIFIDKTFTPEAVGREDFAKDIYAIKLAREYNIILTMNTISDKTRREIAETIKELLGPLSAVDFDRAVKEFKAVPMTADKLAKIEALRTLVAKRRGEISSIYNNEPMPTKAQIKDKPVIIATTEKVAMSDIYLGENMTAANKEGIKNAFIYGDELKDESDARQFVLASGYLGDMNGIKFIHKTDAVNELAGSENVGIRATEGEFGLTEEAIRMKGKLLEIQAINMNDQKVYVAMNSYQALLKMMIAPEGELPPGVSKDEVRGIFKFLPRTVPIDYDKEVRAYIEAIAVIRTAA